MQAKYPQESAVIRKTMVINVDTLAAELFCNLLSILEKIIMWSLAMNEFGIRQVDTQCNDQ